MAGRAFPWPLLAVLIALAAPVAAPAADIPRLYPAGKHPVTLMADDGVSWTEGDETVYLLAGNVWAQQDQTEVKADRVVAWVNREAVRRGRPTGVVVYAAEHGGKAVQLRTLGGPETEAAAAVLHFENFGGVRSPVRTESRARTRLYQHALAARGVPPPADADRATVGTDAVRPAHALQPDPNAPVAPGVVETVVPPAVAGPTVLPVPVAETRRFWLSPRTNRPFSILPVSKGPKGEDIYVITGGIKLAARFTAGSIRSVEMEADQVVIWRQEGSRGGLADLTGVDGAPADGLQVYLSGTVVVRVGGKLDRDPITGRPRDFRIFRADRVYYDTKNHQAIATNVAMEFTRLGYVNTAHLMAPEIVQISATEFTAFEAALNASRLPSDPGIAVRMGRVEVYEEPAALRRTIFGTPFRQRRTGEPIIQRPQIVEATDASIEVLGAPVWYWPFFRTDANDPLGPFQGASFQQSRQFGFQVYGNWDMLELIGLTPLRGERWTLLTDYLSRRGPALGTNYNLVQDTFLGLDAPFRTQVKAYGLYDKGTDILAGPRQEDFDPPAFRGRFLFRHLQDFENLTLQAQFAALSDRNFLEQYYKFEFDSGPNQETFAWLKYQTGNTAATLLVQPPVGRGWVTEANWLPRVDGYLLGETLLDRLTYHTWGSVGYADLRTNRAPLWQYPPPAAFPNSFLFPPPEPGVSTVRADWMQQVSAPFDLGPVRVVPYGVLDLAGYTQDDRGDSLGRLYGGGGVRASVPLSRLYPDVTSELFNLKGLYHKNQFAANYYIAGSTTSYLFTPLLDRLNDDAVRQAYQDVIPYEPTFPQLQGGAGYALAYGSYERFNPRLYAIRRLIDSNPDLRDDIQVLQLEWRQRLQTKRGYPGLEHTVDWLLTEVSASVFPVQRRDNFGTPVGFIEGRAIWNVGDRNGLYANAWVDPFEYGTRYWEVGSFFFRDDRTTLSVSYKHVDPLQSRLVSLSANYVFSPKYAMTAITAYDFGYNESLTNTLLFTRVGTDLAVSLGFSYNSLVNNFSLVFNVVPNLIANQLSPVPYRYGGFGGQGAMGGYTGGGSGGGGGGSGGGGRGR